MIESGDSSHLVLEETNCLTGGVNTGLKANITTNDLDGDLPVNARVFGKVDFTHSSSTEKPHEVIATELGTSEGH